MLKIKIFILLLKKFNHWLSQWIRPYSLRERALASGARDGGSNPPRDTGVLERNFDLKEFPPACLQAGKGRMSSEKKENSILFDKPKFLSEATSAQTKSIQTFSIILLTKSNP